MISKVFSCVFLHRKGGHDVLAYHTGERGAGDDCSPHHGGPAVQPGWSTGDPGVVKAGRGASWGGAAGQGAPVPEPVLEQCSEDVFTSLYSTFHRSHIELLRHGKGIHDDVDKDDDDVSYF